MRTFFLLPLAVLVVLAIAVQPHGIGPSTAAAATASTSTSSLAYEDGVSYPKIASFRAGTSVSVSQAAKYDWIVADGSPGELSFLDSTYAANPHQLQMIQPYMSGSCVSYSGTVAATYGYSKLSCPVSSPWGTLHTKQKSDDLLNPDGTTHQYGSVSVLNWQQYGSDTATAEWSAHVRAKYYLDDLAGGHPQIKGLWGDNDFWSDNGYAWSGVNLSAKSWDTGFIAHHKTLQSAVGPNAIIGGNDLSSMADHPSSYAGSTADGWQLLGGGGQAGMKEGVNLYRGLSTASGVQSLITGIQRWLALKSVDGRQRYDMVNVEEVSPNSATARLGLAVASLSGAYFWIYSGSGGDFGSTWSSWMPEFDKYGSHWLGKPVDDATQVSTGLWTRHFEGGTVALNVSGSSKTVDGTTVPNGDASFIHGTNAPPPPAPAPTPSSTTLGSSVVGGSVDAGGSGYLDVSGSYSLGSAGSVSSLSAYVKGESSPVSVRGVIYTDAGGHPGSLVGTTREVTVASGAAGAWTALPFPSAVSLGAGTYWVGYWYGPGAGSGGGGFAYDSVSGSEVYAPSAYSASGSAPASFPSTWKQSASRYSVYATLITPTSTSAPVNSQLPATSGTATQGQTLTASTGTWSGSPTAYGYAWKDCDASGGACAAIAGATSPSYTLVAADVGHTIRVVVTASNANGSTSASSNATAVVAATPAPSTTLGSSVVGGSVDAGGSGYLDVSGSYSLGSAGSVSSLSAYVKGESSPVSVRGVIYTDAGGHPGSLVGTTREVTVASGAAGAWTALPFPSAVSLGAGTYWVGYWYGPGAGSGGGGFAYDSVSGSEVYAPSAYSASGSAPASFPSTWKQSASRYSVYAH